MKNQEIKFQNKSESIQYLLVKIQLIYYQIKLKLYVLKQKK